ncbi:DUF4197 domain-containing protein [Pseudomarimonas salicorniae]|uniref:DUF4197 domain-containing protein n=1 Tax=Pseudomarimonas salicorniae TaxID=2933270 RepID=A0ABT0GLG1_9GAMM|nr:DUF4197 domain-containing protein [Lysobacter sp. CAU 1642]MCK7595369.1 DUF4197 domain-containing protein [Lysobacter sp. CAU 1642]
MPLQRLLPLLALLVCLPAGADSLKDRLKEAEAKLKGRSEAPAEPKSESAKDTSSSADGLSQGEASSGVKEALAQGVKRAVEQLGRKDGFLADKAVRISTPRKLRKLTKVAKELGAGKYVEQFETSMNRAAEAAVPLAADTFADAVRELTVEDAIGLVRGGDGAATAYLREKTGERLHEQFLPVVAKTTAEAGVTQRYKQLSEKAGEMGSLLGSSDVDLDRYVTDKAIDGLFHYVAEQEKAIRANPLGQASSLLQRVFGKR